jgi:hypothetical protein
MDHESKMHSARYFCGDPTTSMVNQKETKESIGVFQDQSSFAAVAS